MMALTRFSPRLIARTMLLVSCAMHVHATALVELSSVGEFEAFVDKHEAVLLGLFHPCSDACEAFKSLHSTGHRGLQLAVAYGPLADEISEDIVGGPRSLVELPTDDEEYVRQDAVAHQRRCVQPKACEVILFPNFSAMPLLYNGLWALPPLLEWARQSRYPAVLPLTRATHRSLVQESGRAVLWLFVSLHPAGLETEHALAAAQRCVGKHSTQLGALYAQGDSASGRLLQRTVGLDADTALPALAIQAAAIDGQAPLSFVFPPGTPLDPAEVEAFCSDFISGALGRAEAETGEVDEVETPPAPRNASDRGRDEL